MTDNDKITVILNSIRKYFMNKFKICSSDISIENKYLVLTIVSEQGLSYQFLNYDNNDIKFEHWLKNFIDRFNNEIRFQLQYASMNDSFKLLQIFINDNANLDSIIGLLKLDGILDVSTKSWFI